MAEAVNLGPESLLGIPDGQDSRELRNRLDLALRYIANWYKATKGSDDKNLWWAKIDAVRAKVEDAFRKCDPADIFPRASAVAAYSEAALAFPGLYRELALSRDTLPEPSLIDIAGSAFETVLEMPAYIATSVATGIGNTVDGALGSLLSKLAPWLILAALAGGVYVFRAPLLRLAGKAAA